MTASVVGEEVECAGGTWQHMIHPMGWGLLSALIGNVLRGKIGNEVDST